MTIFAKIETGFLEILLHIPVILGSNLNPNTSCPFRGFAQFSSVPLSKYRGGTEMAV
jgi:hypothetical protein